MDHSGVAHHAPQAALAVSALRHSYLASTYFKWTLHAAEASVVKGAPKLALTLKEHDRLVLARQMMMRKLEGRRTSSRLPELVELVMARPLISAGMVAKTLEVTPQGARRIVQELGLREMTGRGRFRAWGIL